MKSKKVIALVLALILLPLIGVLVLNSYTGLLHTALDVEPLENQFPINVDLEDAAKGAAWVTLPFGYTLGPWPTQFKDNPIVMKMAYIKGPPQKFIQQMTQVWDPINAEVTMEGPHTPVKGFGNLEWKSCLKSSFRCFKEKRVLYELTMKDLERWNSHHWQLSWFESQDPFAPRGVHIHLDLQKFRIDRYLIITDHGVTQSFTLKSVKEGVGTEAYALFLKTLGAIKVRDELSNARAWIQSKIQTVRLDQIKGILSPKLRYAKMIQVQTELFSELSVDPTTPAPFFHLAGVSHMLAVDLLKEKNKVYSNQDSWISFVEPQLKAILQYLNDFPKSQTETKNVEALLEDILLLEQKISK